jgi:hypothetical protein
VRRSLSDVTNGSGSKRNALTTDAQPATPFDYMAQNVLVSVPDLFRIGFAARAKSDHARGELSACEAVGVTNFFIKFVQPATHPTKIDELDVQARARRLAGCSWRSPQALSVTAATISAIARSACSFGTRLEPTTRWPPPP